MKESKIGLDFIIIIKFRKVLTSGILLFLSVNSTGSASESTAHPTVIPTSTQSMYTDY